MVSTPASPDPGAAVRAHADAVLADRAGLHDPEAVSSAYLICAAMLKL